MPRFEKSQPERVERPRVEPPELAAFVAGAAVTPPPAVPSLPSPKRRTPRGGSGLEMNVRFTAAEKEALEKLAAAEDRSMQQILSRIAFPALIAAASRLE